MELIKKIATYAHTSLKGANSTLVCIVIIGLLIYGFFFYYRHNVSIISKLKSQKAYREFIFRGQIKIDNKLLEISSIEKECLIGVKNNKDGTYSLNSNCLRGLLIS